jgi:glycerate 2-kinase
VSTVYTRERALLQRMFEAAIASAQPALCVPPHLPQQPPKGRFIVIGAGKASAEMALAVEQHWPHALEGLVVTRYGYGAPCERIEIAEAAHPVPDEAGLVAAQRLLKRVQGLSEDDFVLCLISGGGSALLPLPAPGLTLADKQAVHRALLNSGASIREMNTLRRHLSGIKGGRLAAACAPAKVLTLLISDVPGDDPIDIASGPTVPDPTTCADALEIARRYRIKLPASAKSWLDSGQGESLKPGDARLARCETRIVSAPRMALQAAAEVAQAHGLRPLILGDALEGEAKDVGKVLAGMALSAARHGQPASTPCVLLSGGETTVTMRQDEGGAKQPQGRGGRNVECLLSAALALGSHPQVHALMGDTDGVDGAEEVAGATAHPDTLARAWARGLNPAEELSRHNGHGFFGALGDSAVTGPTRTNVNDFRALMVLG